MTNLAIMAAGTGLRCSSMCGNCLTTAEVLATQVGLIVYVAKDPLHRTLARAGLVPALDLVRRDRTTVQFLRSLDLDPVEIIGSEKVAAADSWAPPLVWDQRPRRARKRSWARPIGSHSLISAQ
jgi:hypothetical protein